MKNSDHFHKMITPILILLSFVTVYTLIYALDHVEKNHALKLDFSRNALYTLSAESTNIARSLPHPVHVYVLSSPGKEDRTLLTLLEQYHAASPMISFSSESIATNPLLLHTISSDLDDQAVTADCMIAFCKETGRTRVLSYQDYLYTEYDSQTGHLYAAGFQYEQKLAEAFLYVSKDQIQQVALLTGHRELNRHESTHLLRLLQQNGFAYQEVNLSRAQGLDNISVLMILSPQNDLTDDELEKILAYVKKGGHLVITLDYSVYGLPHFSALLRYYGVEQEKGVVVADQGDIGSYYQSPLYLMPYMLESKATEGLLHSGQDRLLLAGSAALRAIDKSTHGLLITPLLKTGKAFLRDTTEGFDKKLVQTNEDVIDTYILSFLCEKSTDKTYISKLFILGNTSLFTDQWVLDNTYSGAFFAQMMHTLTGNAGENVQIPPKRVAQQPLGFQNKELVILLCALLSALILFCAVIVLVPRRFR